jgi:four helix bundle protein
MQDYRKLRVWQKAHALALDVRRATQRFPRSGFAGLKSQMTRAAESIPFNIVEGCGADSQKEFARFLDISIKSSGELEYQLLLARDYGVLADELWESLTEAAIDTRRMLCGLYSKVVESDSQRSQGRRRASEKRDSHTSPPR